MKRTLTAALGALFLTVTAGIAFDTPASAQWNRNRVQSILDHAITYVTTGYFQDVRYRAIVLEDRNAHHLIIEMDNPEPRRGKRAPFAQVRVDALSFGRVTIDSFDAMDFRNILFGRQSVRFETSLPQGEVLCRAPLRRFTARDRSIVAECERIDGRRDNTLFIPATPRLPGRTVAPQPVVPVHPRAEVAPPPRGPRGPRALPPTFEADLIAACSDATVGNNAMQGCVQTARPIGFFAVEAVQACAQATVGNSALNECVASVQADSPFTAGIIAACNDATVGNQAVNRCVRVATGASMDPVPVIYSCKDATVGNTNFLSCIESSIR